LASQHPLFSGAKPELPNTLLLCCEHSKISIQTSVFLFVLEEDRSFFANHGEQFEIVAIHEKYRPPLKNIFWHQTILPKLAGKLDLDVIHVPSYRRLVWQSSCPRVGTIHDLAPFRVPKKYDLARMIYGRVIAKHLARIQEHLIAVSENTARDIETFFRISRNRLRVVYNGLEHGRFYPQSDKKTREVSIGKFKLERPFFFICCTVGASRKTTCV